MRIHIAARWLLVLAIAVIVPGQLAFGAAENTAPADQPTRTPPAPTPTADKAAAEETGPVNPSAVEAPTNDSISTPTLITAFPFSTVQNTSTATTAAGDPAMGCGSGGNSNTVWFRLTAPDTGVIGADTIGSGFDTVLAGFSGAPGSLTRLACNDDYSGLQSRIEFPTVAGRVYYLEAADYGSPGGGVLNLRVTFRSTTLAVPVDIVLLQDETGSMSDDITNLKALAPQIWDSLAPIARAGFRMSVAGFRDYARSGWGDTGDWVYRRAGDFTTSRSEFVTSVNRLTAGGGSDTPESQYTALHYLADTAHACLDSNGDGDCADSGDTPGGQQPSFRAGVLRVVLLATDATFHDPSDTFGYPGPSQATVLGALADTGTIVIGLVPGGAGVIPEVDALAAATGGSTQSTGATGSTVVQAILEAIGGVDLYSLSGTITNNSGQPMSGIAVLTDAGHRTVTQANGSYTFSGLSAGTYTVYALQEGYRFQPEQRVVTLPPSQAAQNFVGAPPGDSHLPVVFVHGWHGNGSPIFCSNEQAEPDSYFQELDERLDSVDGLTVEYAYLESSACYTPPLVDNVDELIAAIDRAKARSGRDQVILVAHSMGGLVSRAYIENEGLYRPRHDVHSLFTLGSPHQGIPSDILLFLLFGSRLGDACANYQPAVCDFTTLGMVLFNRQFNTRAAGVNYHLVSGDTPLLDRNATGLISAAFFGPVANDGIVPTSSGLGLNVADRYQTDENHNSFGPQSYFSNRRDGAYSYAYANCLEPVILGIKANCSESDTGVAMAESQPLLGAHTPIKYGVLLPGQTITHAVSIEGGAVVFAAHWASGTVNFRLRAPNGQLIDPAYAAANPAVVSYTAAVDGAVYSFPAAISGVWSMGLQAASVGAGGTNYAAFAVIGTGLTLAGGAQQAWYVPGASATITASLTGATASAAVTAAVVRADGVSQVVALTPLGGGLYQGTYLVPNVPGYATIDLSAAGTLAGGAPFERGTSALFQIAPNTAALSGAYQEWARPVGSQYSVLEINVGVNVATSGNFELSGDLVDLSGHLVAHAFTGGYYSAGGQTIRLRFLGRDIRAAGWDGPFRLTNLLLTDSNGATLVVQEAYNVYTTAAYNHLLFADLPILDDVYLPVIVR